MPKDLGKELRSLSNLIRRYMEQRPLRKKIDSITGTNGWIIGYIADHNDRDIFQKDLESEFTITRSTASKVVGLMVQKGLIEKDSVAGDARLKKLSLTGKAKELAAEMEADREFFRQTLTAGFTQEELEQFCGYIERCKKNLT